jgi:hypothetical protein
VYTPVSRTRLAATVHTPQKLDIVTDFSFLLSNGLEQSATIRFTHAYLPWMLALALAQDVAVSDTGGVTLVGTALWGRWSAYLDRHGDRPDGAYRWYDTLSGAIGARYRRGRARTFLDVAYQPSPVPAQTGRTNYVDGDRVASSAGFDYGLRPWGGALRIGVQVQVHRVLPRETQKLSAPPGDAGGAPQLVVDEVPDDAVVGGQPLPGRDGLQTNNPGWPGYTSQGWVLGAGLHLTVGF